VQITICDVANICVFAKALDLCISGHESASSINDNTALIARCKELRGRAATLIGMSNDPEKVDEQSPFLPMVILVAPPATRGGHLSARLFLDNSCHTSMAGTGAICLAACSRILGSVVCNQIGHEALNDAMLQICHPLGIIPISVQTEKALMASTDKPDFQTLSFIRTSRRIMDGTVYVPAIPQADGS
jgi:2-methylaconitate cis-trans-isomerase PrpF